MQDSGQPETSHLQHLLTTLQHLLALDAVSLQPTLDEASHVLTEALVADKVDIFLYDPEQRVLRALGVSKTPMGKRQQELGFDVLPIDNGGRIAEVFRSGQSFITGHADQDPIERQDMVDGLGIRSEAICSLMVAGMRRGVLHVCSAQVEHFTDEDLRFLEAVTHWVGMVTHRAELVEQLKHDAVELGRREATEELVSLLTPRQREISALIASGMTNAQIAAKLTITAGTVANHVERILSRLGAERRTQIAAWIAESMQNSSAGPRGDGQG